jgi:hypothetical protein
MAENPQLFGNGMPVPFNGEMFVLARDGVEFNVDKIPSCVPTPSPFLLDCPCRAGTDRLSRSGQRSRCPDGDFV